jgi:radical SAM-linked protein
MIHDNTPIKQRLHIVFGKFDALIYTGNLDVAKIWERVLRRAQLPILYSEGFNTRPRIALASALPLGISSECEILDVSLREVISLDGLVERLTATSPAGLKIYDIREVPARSPALQTLVRSAEYKIYLDNSVAPDEVAGRIQALLDAANLDRARERKGKPIRMDVRPLIYDLQLDDAGHLLAHLAVGDQGNLRPDEILTMLELEEHYTDIHRYRLHLDALR